jgi:hypothetical protein
VPLILAVTNKFATSAERRYPAAASVMEAYHVSPSHVAIVNSRPYIVQGALHPADRAKLIVPAVGPPGVEKEKESKGKGDRRESDRGAGDETPEGREDGRAVEASPSRNPEASGAPGGLSAKGESGPPIASISGSLSSTGASSGGGGSGSSGLPGGLPAGAFQGTASFVASAPRSLNPFKRKELVLPVEGVKELRDLVHSALELDEEQALRWAVFLCSDWAVSVIAMGHRSFSNPKSLKPEVRWSRRARAQRPRWAEGQIWTR